MTKNFKFFKTSKNRKIRFSLSNKNEPIIIVFFHGFMSDMEGEKPKALYSFAKKNKLAFLRFEYSGHGKSSGKFIDGSISEWSKDAKEIIKSKIKNKQKIIFIGSSMGAWIALNISKFFKKQLIAFLGIASAPEFTEKIMWKNFTKKLKEKIRENKIVEIKNDYGSTYPITKKLIFDGRKNKVFSKIKLFIPAILFHGSKDKVVPIRFSYKTLKIFKNKGKIIKIKNGDHSLSKKNNLRLIKKELKNLIDKISKSLSI